MRGIILCILFACVSPHCIQAQQLEFLKVFDTLSSNDVFNYLGQLNNKRFVLKSSGGKLSELILLDDSGSVIKRNELPVFQLQPLSRLQPYFWRDQLVLSIVNTYNSEAFQGFIRIDKNGELLQGYTILDSVKHSNSRIGFVDYYYEAIANNDDDRLFFYRAQAIKESNTLSLNMLTLSEQGKIVAQRKENLYFNDIELTRYAFHSDGNMIYGAFYDKVARRGGKSTVKIFEMKSNKLEPTLYTVDANKMELGNLNFVTDPVAKKPIIIAFGKNDGDSRLNKILSFYKAPGGKQWIYSTAPFSKDLLAKIYPKRKKAMQELSPKELKLTNILWDDSKQAPLLAIEGDAYLSAPTGAVSTTFPGTTTPENPIENNAGPSRQFDDIRAIDRNIRETADWGKPVRPEGSLQGVFTGGNDYRPPSPTKFNEGGFQVKILLQDLFIAFADGQTTGVTNNGVSSTFSYAELPLESFYFATKEESVILLFAPARRTNIMFISVSKNGKSKQSVMNHAASVRPFYQNKIVGAGDHQLETLYTDKNNSIGIAVIKWWPN